MLEELSGSEGQVQPCWHWDDQEQTRTASAKNDDKLGGWSDSQEWGWAWTMTAENEGQGQVRLGNMVAQQ